MTEPGAPTSGPRVVLGVSGGIAAYKACEVLRRFTESGHDVTVVPTAAALRFVGAPTWAALSGKPVGDDVWTDVHRVPHVRIGQQADLVAGGDKPEPSIDEQLSTILEQYEAMQSLYGRMTGVNLARKHIGWYTKGLPGSAEFRNRANQEPDGATVLAMLREFYSPWLSRAAA